MSVFGDTNDRATDVFNSGDADSSLAYILAQHTTIVQLRAKNKAAYRAQDAKLRDWQQNVERAMQSKLSQTAVGTPEAGDA